MEPTPLVKAHEHARAAAVATRQASDTTVAINEHTQAAGEFANAARSTSSVEALRTLKLLEEHHRRLAELLNIPTEQSPPSSQNDSNAGDPNDEKASVERDYTADGAGRKEEAAGDAPVSSKTTQKPGLSGQRRIAAREMSSSIASNLASARGIRSKYRGQPLSPSISNDQGLGNVDPHPRRDGSSKAKMKNLIEQQQPGKPAWVPPMPPSPPKRHDPHAKAKPSATTLVPDSATPAAVSDDSGYTRFYNTFGSLISRISTPLAFTGLPLIQEESSISQESASSEISSPKQHRSRHLPSVEPDLSKIFSKATMRAIVNDGHGDGDSFYVVPTSGHTISYANILTYAEKEKRRLGVSNHGSLEGDDDEDDFVDARESPAPLSPGAKRRIGRARTDKELNNTIEELYTENKSLKILLDKLTERLHSFEANAQNMTESYRLMRPGSPLVGTASKSREADEDSAALRKHVEKLERDNQKMQRALEKYREKWETLKAGAKARREAKGGGDGLDEAGPS